MKTDFKIGDYVQIIRKKKCNVKFNCGSKTCVFFKQYGIIRMFCIHHRDGNKNRLETIWVHKMANRPNMNTGCNTFTKKDLRKVSKKEYEQAKVEEQI